MWPKPCSVFTSDEFCVDLSNNQNAFNASLSWEFSNTRKVENMKD